MSLELLPGHISSSRSRLWRVRRRSSRGASGGADVEDLAGADVDTDGVLVGALDPDRVAEPGFRVGVVGERDGAGEPIGGRFEPPPYVAEDYVVGHAVVAPRRLDGAVSPDLDALAVSVVHADETEPGDGLAQVERAGEGAVGVGGAALEALVPLGG